jgi:hypothetical protein
VLSELCKMIVHVKLHIKIKERAYLENDWWKKFQETKKRYGLNDEETSYFVFKGKLENKAYDRY